MKLYTGSGDDGSTGLFGAGRVRKDHPRVEVYGTVDELNACLGLALAADRPDTEPARRMADMLTSIQSRLFDLGADLATPPGSEHEANVRRIADADAAELERAIDEVDSGNDPMRSFILPGGTELAARLHLARTICRRAERLLVSAQEHETVSPAALRFLNRLGDLLFALARRANKEAGVRDVPWTARPDEAGD